MKRSALVTGATRGIGRELVKQLCAAEFQVFATGRDSQMLDDLKRETGCLGETCDLSDAEDCVALYKTAQTALGQIDVLVNNAGFNPGKAPVIDVATEKMDASYSVNFRAPLLLCREALREMGVRQSGHIINVIGTIARTGVYPGGIDTDFRPEARPDYLKPKSAAKMILDCINHWTMWSCMSWCTDRSSKPTFRSV